MKKRQSQIMLAISMSQLENVAIVHCSVSEAYLFYKNIKQTQIDTQDASFA
jgi:hypothetical protein